MAHSKTSIGQILSQAGIGVALFGVFYSSLRREKESNPKANIEQSLSILEEIDKEIEATTSGKIWNPKRREPDERNKG